MKWGRKSKLRLARIAAIKAGVYAHRDRRNNKRNFRRLWQVRINAAVRPHGTTYSKFIHELSTKGIIVDRKILALLAKDYPAAFEGIVKQVMATK
ncbi:50S ribosomal protein L20 [Candidatus Uhrbacteria bacterium]|nr:50S ribosomal protein L20 [Candidatus Uhrbacteria bacterium]